MFISGIILLNCIKNINICIDCDFTWSYSSLSCLGSSGEISSNNNLSLQLWQFSTWLATPAFVPDPFIRHLINSLSLIRNLLTLHEILSNFNTCYLQFLSGVPQIRRFYHIFATSFKIKSIIKMFPAFLLVSGFAQVSLYLPSETRFGQHYKWRKI